MKQTAQFPLLHGRPALREEHKRGAVRAPRERVNRSENCRTAVLGSEGRQTLSKGKGKRASHI